MDVLELNLDQQPGPPQWREISLLQSNLSSEHLLRTLSYSIEHGNLPLMRGHLRLKNEKSWRLLYLVVFKISQIFNFEILLLESGWVPYFFHLVTTNSFIWLLPIPPNKSSPIISCCTIGGDTFSVVLRCPLIRGFTVSVRRDSFLVSLLLPRLGVTKSWRSYNTSYTWPDAHIIPAIPDLTLI